MLETIQKWFYTTFLGELYFRFLLWQDHRRFRKELKYLDLSVQQILINRTSELYREGIRKIKTKVNNLVATKTPEEYDKVLREIEDLTMLSKDDKVDPGLMALYSAYVKKGSDIKNDTDMARMVEERIQHQKEKWKFQEERQLVRQIRKAKQDNDLELAKQLEDIWKEDYGRHKRPGRA